MKQQPHLVDILGTAKRQADEDGEALLAYLIGMALIHASQTAERMQNDVSFGQPVLHAGHAA